jgi:cell filamentation protein
VSYKSEADPYCCAGTTVLIDRLDIRDQARLEAFETDVSIERAAQALPRGRLSYTHYRAIHRHLFQDVYAWAGRIRTVRIFKERSAFCYPDHIDREMKRLFADLAKKKHLHGLDASTFAREVAHFLAELNAIHPFREGKGRTQLSFLTLVAERAGHPLALNRLDPKAVLDAAIASFGGNEKPLAATIRKLIG